MINMDHFPIEADFYSFDPQFSIAFAEEKKQKVPSKLMWALCLYGHPKSMFYELDNTSKKDIIAKDYLKGKFEPKDYPSILDKILLYTTTRVERSMDLWKLKLEERDDLIKTLPYNLTNLDVLEKIMGNSEKLWKQYEMVLDRLNKDATERTSGDFEESLQEKGLI